MDWFESWFDTPYYHQLYHHRDMAEAQVFIRNLLRKIALNQGDFVVDLGCGRGRYSLLLSEMGYRVLGVDLSLQNIEHNQKFKRDNLEFLRQDMREEFLDNQADAVLNLFTSFGYFEDEKEDLKVFQSVNKALKKGGFFVLDFLNKTFVERHLEPFSIEKRGEITFEIYRKIENETIYKDIKFQDKGREFFFQERVKLHSSEQILRYAEQVGMERVELWGDYHLNDFQEEYSSRCINVFKKN